MQSLIGQRVYQLTSTTTVNRSHWSVAIQVATYITGMCTKSASQQAAADNSNNEHDTQPVNNVNRWSSGMRSSRWDKATDTLSLISQSQRSRSQGHKVQKRIEWSTWVMHSIECLESSYSNTHTHMDGRTWNSSALYPRLAYWRRDKKKNRVQYESQQLK